MQNIIFIAPPAAGKGTVSEYLIKNYNYNHLSAGDLLRNEVAQKTPLGNQIEAILNRGDLVADDLIIELVKKQLVNISGKPFIIDGFPRTLTQAQKLDEMLVTNHITNNKVIYLNISLDNALKRILGRAICPNCQRTYNLNSEKLRPKNNDICDDCANKLIHRNDDNEETFNHRFATYLENTAPILEYYRKKGILNEVEVDDDLEKLLNKVIDLVKPNSDKKEAKND